MDGDRLQQIKNGGLLDVVRTRTALYTGKRSLSALSYFLDGWRFALQVYNIQVKSDLPDDFHGWVAYRLGFYESTGGYRAMILNRIPDESAALDRFFELLDEHRERKHHIVARTAIYRKDRIQQLRRVGSLEEENLPNLNLVSYTDDPGFFVMFDGEELMPPIGTRFFPTLESFKLQLGAGRENFTILDPEMFNLWLAAEDRFKSAL
ncbi:MAG TPA: hypothetical protein VKZ53_11225 [Candidatus Angelobacter sp.]|nr:hypothetical protein [Candidatus Angelobacter sp.]